jgi:hypothetical protein
MSEWIGVEDKLPELKIDMGSYCMSVDLPCLTKDNNQWFRCHLVGTDDGDLFWGSGEISNADERVTHWMPIPDPPEEAS